MTPEAQSKRTNTVLIAIADALLAAVMVPLGIYLTKSMIEVKTELAKMQSSFFSREELIAKGDQIRTEGSELRSEIVKLRAEVEIINKRLERYEDRK
jgi:hypothetical protein